MARLELLSTPTGRAQVLDTLAATHDVAVDSVDDGPIDRVCSRGCLRRRDLGALDVGQDTLPWCDCRRCMAGETPIGDVDALRLGCRCESCRRRVARMAATRANNRFASVERYEHCDPRLLVLTQAPTPIEPGASLDDKRKALALDTQRMSDKLRRLTLSEEWRERATAWVFKIEATWSTPESREALYGEAGPPSSWWHVHTHAVVWGESYWEQDKLKALWVSTSGEQGGVNIQWPRAGLIEALKYAVKPVSLAKVDGDGDLAACLIGAWSRVRLMRVGGALEGVQLSDDEEESASDSDDEQGERETDARGHVVDIVDGVEVRARYRTISGRWVDPRAPEVWSEDPAEHERARAWLERQWWVWHEERRDMRRVADDVRRTIEPNEYAHGIPMPDTRKGPSMTPEQEQDFRDALRVGRFTLRNAKQQSLF